MNNKLENLLKENLRPDEEPGYFLNQRILENDGTIPFYEPKRRFAFAPKAVIAVCICALLCFGSIKLINTIRGMSYKYGNVPGNSGEDIDSPTVIPTKDSSDSSDNQKYGVCSASMPCDFNKLSLNLTSVETVLKTHKSDELLIEWEVTESDDKDWKTKYRIYTEKEGNDSLYISTGIPNVSLKKQYFKAVTVYIPEDKVPDLEISLTSCTFDVENLVAKTIELNDTSGSVDMGIKSAEELIINSTSSNINILAGSDLGMDISGQNTSSIIGIGDETGIEDSYISDSLNVGSQKTCNVTLNTTSSIINFITE